MVSQAEHENNVKQEYQRRQDVIDGIERKKIEKELFKQARREAREQRRIQQELQKLRTEIKTLFIDKWGEVKEHIANQDVMDITGNYEKGKTFMGVYGGMSLQMIVILQALQKYYSK